jgi:AcrR family transcriptional regulator
MRGTMPRLKAPQRKKQIIDVATRIFARYGYNAATTHTIAEAAGVTEPILYRHFKGKQEMFVAITRQMSKETLAHWQELIADEPSPEKQIRLIAKEFPLHQRRLADAYNVIHGALATSHDRKVTGVLREHYQQTEQFFIGIIRRGQEAGQFRKDLDPTVPAWQLINIGIGYSMVSLNLPATDHFSPTKAIEFILRAMKA